MASMYRQTGGTLSLLHYHFVFCTRYRRKVFLICGLEDCFRKTVLQICEQNDIQVISIDCKEDHVHLLLDALPKWSPADIMRLVRTGTTKTLLASFASELKGPTIWTRNFLVSDSIPPPPSVVEKFLNEQKLRG